MDHIDSYKKFVNTEEAAKILHKTPQSLRNDRHHHRGPTYYKLGKKVLYALSDLYLYIDSNRIDPEQN